MIVNQMTRGLRLVVRAGRFRPISSWLMMLPYKDINPCKRYPHTTHAIIGICVTLFFIHYGVVPNPAKFTAYFGYIPAKMWETPGLLTGMFLHSGILHLAGNMLYLYLFGDNIEDRFTTKGYVLFFLLGGAFAGLSHGVLTDAQMTPCVGASGAIAALMGAYFVFYPHAKVKMLFMYIVTEVKASFFLGGWILLQVISSLAPAKAGVSRVAWYAHIGGFIFGMMVAFIKLKLEQKRQLGTVYEKNYPIKEKS